MSKTPSRRERLEQAVATISNGKDDIEALRDELQNWLDNMPENLQASSKADQLQEAIDALQEMIDSVECIETIDVQFPGMMG